MIKRLKIAAFSVLLASLAPATIHAAGITLEAKLDSAHLLMGKVTTLNVRLVKKADIKGSILVPVDTIAEKVEIAGALDPDTSDLGNGIQEIKQRIILQSFDSGLYTLQPVLFVTEAGDTIISNRPVLKVNPVNVDTLANIHDYADAREGESKFFDFLPDFLTDYGIWMLIAMFVIIGGIIVYFKYLKKGRIPLIPQKKQEPPYEQAIKRLNALRVKQLCEQGREKEFYTSLTDILRDYLERRFNINAMEMTSTQILHALEHNEATRMPRRHMQQLLEIADFVKFAKVRPLPDDNVKAFNNAMQFVEDTKPVPVETGTDSTPKHEPTKKEAHDVSKS